MYEQKFYDNVNKRLKMKFAIKFGENKIARL